VTLNEFQKEVMRTFATRKDPTLQLAVMGLGVAGEAGEVADMLKKHIGHGHPLDITKLEKEMGDVLWYLAAIALCCNTTLETVAEANIVKLRSRYPDGFSRERSIHRAPEDT
jgi:NTP pyrophosphatase (non-canonical NTP hydrolase)